ncbi:hypothetical protein [Amycolatopsis anabasis]|uniref:hypothetical protein n=1 Tax=Amycolatopsis anabasis TaxID=1840409 RepID=UPI00131EA3A7|nr:hypothetical protein [Amycolatopsis anabasis]
MNDVKATPPSTEGHFRRLRQLRGSAPITRDLYELVDDPVVIAFHLAAMFHDPDDHAPLTLDALRARWKVGLPKARDARKFLINNGYWAEVRTYGTRGERYTVTVTWEAPLTLDDLCQLAVEYRPKTLIRCGGQKYLTTADHRLTVAPDKAVDNFTRTRATENSRSARPGRSPSDRQNSHGRQNPTDGEETAGRADQRTAGEDAGQPDRKKTKGNDHGFSSLKERKHHDPQLAEFWSLVSVAGCVDQPGRRSVRNRIQVALAGPWTPTTLAAWVNAGVKTAEARPGALSNVGGYVISMLAAIPAAPPDGIKPGPPAWCGDCGRDRGDDLAKFNVRFRILVDPDTGSRTECPKCHPNSVTAQRVPHEAEHHPKPAVPGLANRRKDRHGA